MGIFELGNPEKLNEKQLVLVKEHLNLVTYREYTFCNWLNGFLDATDEKELSSKQLSKILEKLRSEFLNVIDTNYPKYLLDNLYAAHEGRPIQSKKVIINNPKFEALC
jgi:hypothetical protein